MTTTRWDGLADRLRRVEVWAVVAAVVPIVVAVGRHLGGRWAPIGDNALIELRSRDVFSATHFPFLGTWSSASLTAGVDLNHPGPLLFDLLAVPVRVFGGANGVAIGVGIVNVLSVVGIAMVAYRMAGRSGCLLATLTAALFTYSMGSGMVADPWNPHVLMLPCLLLFMLSWAVGTGSFRLLPWLVAIGSLCLQTHLGYAYLVPIATVVAIAGALAVHRRRWRLDAGCRADDVGAMRRTTWITLGTLVVLWAQPLVEQFTGDGQGNLSRIVSSAGGGDEPVVGARIGARIIAAVVVLPPWWSRSSIVDAVPYTRYGPDGESISPVGLPGGAATVVALVVWVAVIGSMLWLTWRRGDRVGFGAVGIAAVMTAVALATLTVMPIGPLGLTPHQMRWVWSLAAFTWFAVALAVVRAVVDAHRARSRWITIALCVGVAGVAVANLPADAQLVGPDSFQASIPAAVDLSSQVDDYRTTDRVLIDTAGLRYLEPYSAVVMAALERGGVDFRVIEEGLVRQVGNARRATGDEPRRLVLREAREALVTPEGMERIAFTSPLSPADIDELLAGEQVMADTFAVDGVVLSAAGEVAVDEGRFGMDRIAIEAAGLDAAAFVGSGLAAELVAAGALDLGDADAAGFERTATLRRMLDVTTVAVFVGPA